ncbi:MAG: type II toxin-antitoxin system RelE/ParE family toxin [bacterium]|nr:type II toxin-antitoxin system RelE/ParE family toxin [bacterium]MCY4258032.1 type II toxin-antitoxin system RelE/ParE family toxin [bacterium]
MQASLRAAASTDIHSAATYYRDQVNSQTAVDFIDQLEAAIEHLRRHPHIGSLQFSYELEIPDLRSWPLNKFPYLIFYVPKDNHIDIWRVLHSRRDIPAILTSEPQN